MPPRNHFTELTTSSGNRRGPIKALSRRGNRRQDAFDDRDRSGTHCIVQRQHFSRARDRSVPSPLRPGPAIGFALAIQAGPSAGNTRDIARRSLRGMVVAAGSRPGTHSERARSRRYPTHQRRMHRRVRYGSRGHIHQRHSPRSGSAGIRPTGSPGKRPSCGLLCCTALQRCSVISRSVPPPGRRTRTAPVA